MLSPFRHLGPSLRVFVVVALTTLIPSSAMAASFDLAAGPAVGGAQPLLLGGQLFARAGTTMAAPVSIGARARLAVLNQPNWSRPAYVGDLSASLRLITENGDADNLVFAGLIGGLGLTSICSGDVCGVAGIMGGGEIGTTMKLSEAPAASNAPREVTFGIGLIKWKVAVISHEDPRPD